MKINNTEIYKIVDDIWCFYLIDINFNTKSFYEDREKLHKILNILNQYKRGIIVTRYELLSELAKEE